MARPIRRPIIEGVDNSHEYWPERSKRDGSFALAVAVAVLGVAIFAGLIFGVMMTETGNMLIDSAQRFAVSFRVPKTSTPSPIVFAALDALARLCGVK